MTDEENTITQHIKCAFELLTTLMILYRYISYKLICLVLIFNGVINTINFILLVNWMIVSSVVLSLTGLDHQLDKQKQLFYTVYVATQVVYKYIKYVRYV